MLLTVSTTARPASDLGYLLHKHPDRVQEFPMPFGTARVFYPESSEYRCTVALLVEIDPIELVRGSSTVMADYVNDRPYTASSFLTVAMKKVFGTAMAGRCDERPELVTEELPLEALIAPIRCQGGEDTVRSLFEPLGYRVALGSHSWSTRLDWGRSPYYTLHLEGRVRLSELLNHLYVLIPVLDGDKHYWISEDEITKLLDSGKGWLTAHPERELITRAYLKRQRSLVSMAMTHLLEADGLASEDDIDVQKEPPLHTQRIDRVFEELIVARARRVVDLGCGEGRLMKRLLDVPEIEEVHGVDVSHRALEICARRLHLDQMSDRQRARVKLTHGSLTYRDRRLNGYDAAAAVEVIEHLDPWRLDGFAEIVFGQLSVKTIVLTTPNVDHNIRYGLEDEHLRHFDHRFEWTQAQFAAWCETVAGRYGYVLRMSGIGDEDPEVGSPSQLAVFNRSEAT